MPHYTSSTPPKLVIERTTRGHDRLRPTCVKKIHVNLASRRLKLAIKCKNQLIKGELRVDIEFPARCDRVLFPPVSLLAPLMYPSPRVFRPPSGVLHGGYWYWHR